MNEYNHQLPAIKQVHVLTTQVIIASLLVIKQRISALI